MKLFKNKKTEEMYLCMTYSENACSLMSLHDNGITMLVGEAMNDFEEVNVAPVKQEPTYFQYQYMENEEISFDDIQKILNGDSDMKETFSVNNVLHIPVQGYENPISFEVVHINDEERSLYLMPRDILARMPMSEVEAWLKDFKSKLPWDLVEHLKPIEHINSTGTHRSLISLPSIRNMGKDVDYCTGKDDVMFDKFKDEASRCKNFEGETQWYWTDTSHISISATFWIVGTGGGYGYYGANSNGVCPLLKLSKDKPVKK